MNLPLQFHERRIEERTPMSVAARVWYGAGGVMWADCTVRDLSVGGARIEIPSLYELPQRVFFGHRNAQAIFMALVKWRRGDAAGLSFASGCPLEDCQKPPLDRLAADWRAICS